MRSRFFIDQYVILKDGHTRLPMSTVTTVFNHLDELRQHETRTYYQFVQHCRVPEENILKPDNLPISLTHRNLIDSYGKVSDEVKAIVVCAVEGTGINMFLVSPVKFVEQSGKNSCEI